MKIRIDQIAYWFEVVWRISMGLLMLLVTADVFFVMLSPLPKAWEPEIFPLFLGGGVAALVWSASTGLWFILSGFPRWSRATHILAVIGFGIASISAVVGAVFVGDPRFIPAVPNAVPFTLAAFVSFLFCFRKVRNVLDWGTIQRKT